MVSNVTLHQLLLTTTDNNWGPINDLQVILQLPNNRAILSAYQLSTEMSSPSHLVTALNVNGFYQLSTPCIRKATIILLPYKVLMLDNTVKRYIILMFSTDLLQCSPSQTANMITKTIKTCMLRMMLPPSCKVVLVNPRTTVTTIASNVWTQTDLQYSLGLSRESHVIIMYQYTGYGAHHDYHLVTRIKINTAVEKHTVYHSGYSNYHGNFRLWQGSLKLGTHTILVEYRNRFVTYNRPHYWQTRALNIVYC